MLFDDDAARPLMDYQRQVKEAGMMRPYNYWVLSQDFRRVPAVADEHTVQWQDHRVVRRAPDVRSRPLPDGGTWNCRRRLRLFETGSPAEEIRLASTL